MEIVVGDIQDRMIEGKRLRGNLSNPRRDIYPMLFDLTIEKGTCLTAVFSAIRVIKDFICSVSFSNRSIIEHPERMSVFKDFNIYTSAGRLLKLVQSFKFSSVRLDRHPIDWCTSCNPGQSLRMSCSRLDNPEKLGVSIKYLE